MKSKTKWWVDALIIAGMMIVVYLLCQPLGRDWSKAQEELYTGTEGVYSMDADSYYYLRKAKEFTENGFSSINVFSSRSEDALITSIRTGERDFLPNLLSAIAAIVWYMLNGIGVKVGIYALATHLPACILALFVIPIYLFLKKRITIPAAAAGALFATLAPPYLKHSLCTFFDTDALIGLLAIVLILSLYECVLCKNSRGKIVYGIISCLTALLLYCTWKIFYVYVIIAVGTTATALIILHATIGKKINDEPRLRIPLIFMGVQTLIALVLGAKDAIDTIASNFGTPGSAEVWPSSAAYVGELTRPSLYEGKLFWDIFLSADSDYISYFGGLFCFVLLLVSVAFCLFRVVKMFRNRKNGAAFEEAFLLLAIGAWFCGTVVMCFFGIRFMEFAILPSALIMSYGVHWISGWLLSEKRTLITKRILYVCVAMLLFAIFALQYPVLSCVLGGAVLLFGFFGSYIKKGYALVALFLAVVLLGSMEGAYLIGTLGRPLFEKNVEDAMLWIRDNTDEDAVIINFWDFGYMYQYTAERRTVSDGGTYNGAFTYWLAEMMATDNLELSAGIARMLQNSGLDATEYAEQVSGGKAKACSVLKEILALPEEEAVNVLYANGYSAEQAAKLLGYTHPKNCPDMYLVVNYHLLRLSSTLDYYTSWDFTGNTVARADTLLGEESFSCPEEGESVNCKLWNRNYSGNESAVITATDGMPDGCLLSGQVLVDTQRVVYIKDGEIVRDTVKDNPAEGHGYLKDYALLIMEENGQMSVLACDKALVDSALFRLYLFNGKGQSVFERVFAGEVSEELSGDTSSLQRRIGTTSTRDLTNCGISIWKIH